MGVDEVCSWSKITKIEQALRDVDAVMFTHATYKHIGAFPILFSLIKEWKIKIFATFPCIKFGVIGLYEYFIEKVKMEIDPLFKISDVDEAFASELMTAVNFHQNWYIKIWDKGSI